MVRLQLISNLGFNFERCLSKRHSPLKLTKSLSVVSKNREIELGCASIIRMEGKKTCILNPNPKPDIVDNNEPARKEFTFDYSYWSADKDHPDFSNQEQIYNDLGRQTNMHR